MTFTLKRLKMSLSIMAASFAMFGCESHAPNQAAQQQNFICKSLIDGFLNTQDLGQYQLQKIKPSLDQTSRQRDYVYSVSSDNNVKLNMPKRHDLKFQCNQFSAQRFSIALLDPTERTASPLLSIDLPPKHHLQKLIAYSMNKP